MRPIVLLAVEKVFLRIGSAEGYFNFILILLSLDASFSLAPVLASSSGLADLVPGNIINLTDTVNRTHACAGVTTRFEIFAKNQGTGSTNVTFAIQWYVKNSTNSTISSQIQQPYGPLPAGASSVSTFDWLSPQVSSGTYLKFTVGVFVDAFNNVVESNKSNNRNETVILVGRWNECGFSYDIIPRPTSLSVVPGESANFTVEVKRTFGLSQTVNLTVTNSGQLASNGIAARFSVNSSLVGDFMSTLTVKTKAITAYGSYPIDIKGTSQNNTVVFNSTSILVQAAFSIGPQTVTQGFALNATVYVRVHGTNVALSAKVVSSSVNIRLTWNPGSISLNRTETEKPVTLSITTFENTTATNYAVSLLAVGAEVNGTGSFNLRVVPLTDYFFVADQRACALDPRSANRDCSLNVIIYSGGRYNGTVTLRISEPSGLDLLVSSAKNSTQRTVDKFGLTFLILGAHGKSIQNYNDTIFLHVRSGAPNQYLIDFYTVSNATRKPDLYEFDLILLKSYAVPTLQTSMVLGLFVVIAFIPAMVRRRQLKQTQCRPLKPQAVSTFSRVQ